MVFWLACSNLNKSTRYLLLHPTSVLDKFVHQYQSLCEELPSFYAILLGFFTIGASPMSIRHGFGCGIPIGFGQPSSDTLTKIYKEIRDKYNDFGNKK